MANHTYVGFSTAKSKQRTMRQWKLYDMDLIQQDLLNHFNTRMGERLGRPTFGCRIWDYLMQQRSSDIVEEIQREAKRVCTADSRIIFLGCQVSEYRDGIVVAIELQGSLTGNPVEMKIRFDERQSVATRG
jgi:phage baseplate assembly protein W